MKKIISWILLAATLLGLFAGCGASEAPATQPSAVVESTAAPEAPVLTENNAADVIAYLRTIYKDSGSKTSGNFERFGIVRIAGVPYEVVWTASVGSDKVQIYGGEKGMTVIDVNEKCTEDTLYTLTATVTDGNGNTESADWEYLLPGAASLEEMQAIVDQAYALAVGEAMTEEKTLTGVISSIDTVWSDQYQNITVSIIIEGREDKPIMCYRLKGEGAKDLVVGDTITVQGILKNYNNKIEFDAGCQLTMVEKTGTAIEIPTDMVQIMDDVYALGNNESLPYGPVTLIGNICSIEEPYTEQYKNVTVTIRMGYYTIKCYRMKGAGIEDLEMNDIITVKGYIKKYNGIREFDYPELVSVEKVGPYTQPKDQMEVVKAAYNLDPAWMLPYSPVTLTGTVTSPGTWSDEFENRNVTFVVDGDTNKEYPMYCYRLTYADESTKEAAKNLAVGDKITVKGMIINHVFTRNGEATGETKVQFTYPELIAHTPAPNPDKGPFNKISQASELVSGKYVMIVSTGYAPGSVDGKWISTTQPVVEGNVVTDSKNGVWTLSVYGNQVKIKDAAGNTIAPVGGATNGISTGDYKWNWTRNNDGTFTFSGVGDDTVKLASNANTDPTYGGFHKFRAYKNSTISNAPATYPCDFTLYLMPGSEFEPAPDDGSGESTNVFMTEAPKDGDKVVIVAAKYNQALSTTKVSTYYNAGVNVTASNGKLNGYSDSEVWTVIVNDDGSYSFENGGLKIAMQATNSSMLQGAVHDKWTLSSLGEGLFNIVNVGRPGYAMEWYASKGNFSTYNKNITTDNQFFMAFYLVEFDSSIKDGQYAIYAPNFGKAATALASSSNYGYLPSVTASVVDGKLVCNSESVWFTLTNNGDSSFTLQDASGRYYYLSGTYNSYNVTTNKPTDGSADWVLEEVDGGIYVKNVAKSKYISYANSHSNFGAYADPGTNSILQLVAKGSEIPEIPENPETPETPENSDPAANSTLTVVEAIALGSSKEHNVYTTGKYYVSGEVTEIYNTTFGNLKIKDNAGNILTVYGTYDSTGANRFDAMATKPAVGDTIKVYGVIGQYNGTPQLKNGWIMEIKSGSSTTPDEPETPAVTDATITFDNVSKRTVFNTSQQVWVENGITVTNDKASSSSNVANYSKPARFYASSKLTIEYPGMTKIEFTCNSTTYATALKNSITGSTVSGKVVTVELSEPADSFVVAKLSAQVRMDSIKVYAEAAEPELKVSTIAEALAAATGTELKITGYVNMVDGSKVYVQDATGAIRVDLASSGAQKGDTVTFTGTKAAGSVLTGTAAEKAANALSQFVTTEKLMDVSSDVHMYHYMNIDNQLTIVGEEGDYIVVADEEDNQIKIFDPVCAEPAKLVEGAVITFKGIMADEDDGFMIFKNTDASEITIVKEAPAPVTPPATPTVHVVDFETITTTNANGGDSSYTKTFTTASGWKTTNSAIQVGGANDVNPQFTVVGPDNSYKAVCLNGKTSAPGKVTSPTLTGGISRLTMDYTKMFTDTTLSVTITITDKATGNTYSKVVSRTEDKNTKYVVWTFDWVLDTPISGDFTIEIENDCPSGSTSNKDRFTILDMVWYS